MTNEVLQKIASDEQNISSSNGLEPKLRFKEFDGKWSRNILGNCCDIIMGQSPDSSSYNNNCIGLPLVQGNADMCERIATPQRYTSQPTKICEAGSIILSVRAPVGTVGKTFQKICLGRGVCGITSKNIEFMYQYLLNNENSWRHIEQGGTFTAIYSDDIKSFPIILPSLPEQKKIADFLSLIDQRIEKQRQLVENLKKYKRGLLSAIFDNKLIGENWKKYKLSSILKERSTYSEKDGSYEHVTLSRDGIIPKTERYDRDFLVSSENKKYKITKMGDICYNPANMKFGVICLNTYGNAIFSPIYITFEIKSDFDKPFVGLYMTRNDFINRSLKFQQGTVYERMAVSPEDLLSMDIELPNLEAQKRISNIFTILDKKIVRENNIFNELQKMKRALLQQMFI